ncbi:C-type lectin domain family 2 member L-like [Caloenas nicobarica]|uniref:C-type lectin domain family 2 member L-like n=1 Tax=Caloenas nicobarica TaxID=187106 RepID=UPI0032B7F3A3
MASEDEQEAGTTQMAQAPVGTIGSTNVNQNMAAISWQWKPWRHYKCFWSCLLLVVLVVAIIIIAFVVKPEASAQHCPSEWVGYKKKCYFISEEEKNWTSSQTFCNNNESLLATFENQEEMHSLAKLLKIDDCWIGLCKKGESFYWENGIALKEELFQIRNHSECAYLDGFTISTSACSLPRRWICVQPHKAMT